MKYISLLRGINVSGKKRIKMDDLKSIYEANGFDSVTTYIQSGNVIFESDITNRDEIRKRIEGAIEKYYEFNVPVNLRTNQELEEIVRNCPFVESESEDNGTKVLVSFLRPVPIDDKSSSLLGCVIPPERLFIQGKEVYLYCPNGYGKSKLKNTFIEKKLGMSATTRNWKSVKNLYELSGC